MYSRPAPLLLTVSARVAFYSVCTQSLNLTTARLWLVLTVTCLMYIYKSRNSSAPLGRSYGHNYYANSGYHELFHLPLRPWATVLMCPPAGPARLCRPTEPLFHGRWSGGPLPPVRPGAGPHHGLYSPASSQLPLLHAQPDGPEHPQLQPVPPRLPPSGGPSFSLSCRLA